MVPMWGVSIAFEDVIMLCVCNIYSSVFVLVPFFGCYSCCVFGVLLNTRAEMQRYVAERFVQLPTQKGE